MPLTRTRCDRSRLDQRLRDVPTCRAEPSLHRHRLREIARLIDVAILCERDVIGEQLQRNVEQQGIELGSDFGTSITPSTLDRQRFARCVIDVNGPRRARISSIVDMFFANRSSRGIMTMVGVSGLISASGPCFSSDAG